jgi:hypothetical protein
MKFRDNLLYTGGIQATAPLAMYDINTMQCVKDIRVSNLEVFKLYIYNGIGYFGSRGKNVGRVALNSFTLLDPFNPPHYEIVTSFALLKDSLVSGSKQMRFWDVEKCCENMLNNTGYKEMVTALESTLIIRRSK